jgi:hypothetical protein
VQLATLHGAGRVTEARKWSAPSVPSPETGCLYAAVPGARCQDKMSEEKFRARCA